MAVIPGQPELIPAVPSVSTIGFAIPFFVPGLEAFSEVIPESRIESIAKSVEFVKFVTISPSVEHVVSA
jgi:hypothetical protein